MDKDQASQRFGYFIDKLRSITLAVQLLPFVYGFLYVIAILSYIYLPEQISVICDHLLYVSVCVIVYNLILSRILKLCIWHKSACLVPLYPEIISITDYFFDLSSNAEEINMFTILFMTITLLVSAYFVFLAPKQNGRR